MPPLRGGGRAKTRVAETTTLKKRRFGRRSKSSRDDWGTPDVVLDLVRKLTPSNVITLDPCTRADNPTGAYWRFTRELDGLTEQWAWILGAWHVHPFPVCFVNPPYGRALATWARKIAEECARFIGVHCVTLVPARTDTIWFRTLRQASNAIAFWNGRLTFKGATDPAEFPSALFYSGPEPDRFCELLSPHAWTLRLK